MPEQLRLTKDDVGKKFRRRDGRIVTVLKYDGSSMPVKTDPGWWHYPNGRISKAYGNCDEDLIERITEEPVSEFNWDKFNEVLGQSTNICGGAKKDIERAIAAGKGNIHSVEPAEGQIWTSFGSVSMLVRGPNGREYVVRLGHGFVDSYQNNVTWREWLGRYRTEFKANSLKEYLDNGGKL